MGLDVSHDCWHGAYSAFMRWRTKIAEVAGLPPLELMEGFYHPNYFSDPFARFDGQPLSFHAQEIQRRLPIKWDALKPNPLHELLYHSDCDGSIHYKKARGIADELEKLLPLLPDEIEPGHIGNWKVKTQYFIDGLRCAAKARQMIRFG